jgi:hypothetical protein
MRGSTAGVRGTCTGCTQYVYVGLVGVPSGGRPIESRPVQYSVDTSKIRQVLTTNERRPSSANKSREKLCTQKCTGWSFHSTAYSDEGAQIRFSYLRVQQDWLQLIPAKFLVHSFSLVSPLTNISIPKSTYKRFESVRKSSFVHNQLWTAVRTKVLRVRRWKSQKNSGFLRYVRVVA